MSQPIGHDITTVQRHCSDCGLPQDKGRKLPKATHGNQYNAAGDVGVPIDRYLSSVDRMADLCLGCVAERRLEGETISRFATFDEYSD